MFIAKRRAESRLTVIYVSLGRRLEATCTDMAETEMEMMQDEASSPCASTAEDGSESVKRLKALVTVEPSIRSRSRSPSPTPSTTPPPGGDPSKASPASAPRTNTDVPTTTHEADLTAAWACAGRPRRLDLPVAQAAELAQAGERSAGSPEFMMGFQTKFNEIMDATEVEMSADRKRHQTNAEVARDRLRRLPAFKELDEKRALLRAKEAELVELEKQKKEELEWLSKVHPDLLASGAPSPVETAPATVLAACASLWEKINTIDAEIGSRVREATTCIVCKDRKREVLFSPCGHVLCCKVCAMQSLAQDDRCPVCRALVQHGVDFLVA